MSSVEHRLGFRGAPPVVRMLCACAGDPAAPDAAAWPERAFEIAQRSLRVQRRLVALAGGLAAARADTRATRGWRS